MKGKDYVLHVRGLALEDFGPLNLRLSAGEGAVVTHDNLDVLRALMRCCLGEREPDSGTIEWWREHRPADNGWEAYDFYRQIGYVDRHSQLLGNMTLLETLMLRFAYALAEGPAAEEAARETLAALGLSAYEQRPTDYLPEPWRRLALYALALCGRPRLLLMERPRQFLGSDFQRVWDFLRRPEMGLAYVVFDRHAEQYGL